ncbi:MAG: methylmalonyl-CoA mutase, partial [Cytophagaceae bacterium]|nr:methylmalonyl-CoA mutase [Gemmatimonadaceae bacterium]
FPAPVQRALEALGKVAATYAAAGTGAGNASVMPLVVDAVRARATVGEISDVFRERFGEYRPA